MSTNNQISLDKDFASNPEYIQWLTQIKEKVVRCQIKAVLSANRELIHFYFDLGKMIAEKQSLSRWGDKLINRLSIDLKKTFPDLKGLSATNLKYCKRFYTFYQEPFDQSLVDAKSTISTIGQQAVDQIPWGHNILIFTRTNNGKEAQFYIREIIENNWSRDTLALQIKSNLFHRQGKAVTNFQNTLPTPQSDLAEQSIKDPYVFDFLTLTKPYHEKDIEKQLVEHVTKFLLELGKGFAFIGRQVHLEVADSDYYLDLLFYHVVLKCYVVIELKNTKFTPESAGKMNFYLSAVDSIMKKEDDKPTIGIVLCREKNNIEVEFALRDLNKPMGVSEFQFTELLPESLHSSLPTIEEIENELIDIKGGKK